MLISLFPTPFGHFQFLGSAGRNPKLILTLCLKGPCRDGYYVQNMREGPIPPLEDIPPKDEKFEREARCH